MLSQGQSVLNLIKKHKCQDSGYEMLFPRASPQAEEEHNHPASDEDRRLRDGHCDVLNDHPRRALGRMDREDLPAGQMSREEKNQL